MSHEISEDNGSLKDIRFLAWRVAQKQRRVHEKSINQILNARPRLR